MSTPYDHKFLPDPGERHQCGFYFDYPNSLGQMINAMCGGDQDHEWHIQPVCWRCEDRGVWWTEYGTPLPCRDCEQGAEMSEFLIT